MTKLIICIPAYNEEKTIASVIREIPRDIADEVTVVVIDDGSTDKTARIAKEAGADRVISFRENKGLGIAFKKGIDAALKMNADIFMNIDADGQFNLGDIPKLINPLIEGKADVAICSRFLDKQLAPEMPKVKRLGNKIFTKLINLVTNQDFTDTQCGFRAYTRDAILRINLFSRYTYTQETLIDILYKGLRVVEVPCGVKGEREGDSRLVDNVFSYGLRALLIVVRTIRDHKPLRFFGSIGASVFLSGIMIGFGMFVRWAVTGTTSPYASLIDLSVMLTVLGFLLIFLALIADMFDRHRRIQEEILYYNKLRIYGDMAETRGMDNLEWNSVAPHECDTK